MGVDGRSSMYPSGCPNLIRNDAMTKQSTATAFDHDSTLVLALELRQGMGSRCGVAGDSAAAASQPAGPRHGRVAAADRAMEGRSAADRPNRVPDRAGLRGR